MKEDRLARSHFLAYKLNLTGICHQHGFNSTGLEETYPQAILQIYLDTCLATHCNTEFYDFRRIIQHETHLSTICYEKKTHSWISGANENAWWKSCNTRSSCQRSCKTRRLSNQMVFLPRNESRVVKAMGNV